MSAVETISLQYSRDQVMLFIKDFPYPYLDNKPRVEIWFMFFLCTFVR